MTDITQQELLQLIGEKELKIYFLQKEMAALQQKISSLEIIPPPLPPSVTPPSRPIGNTLQRFSKLTEQQTKVKGEP